MVIVKCQFKDSTLSPIHQSFALAWWLLPCPLRSGKVLHQPLEGHLQNAVGLGLAVQEGVLSIWSLVCILSHIYGG